MSTVVPLVAIVGVFFLSSPIGVKFNFFMFLLNTYLRSLMTSLFTPVLEGLYSNNSLEI